jgi:hypothetical protein
VASVSPATHSIVVTKTEFRGPPRIRDLSADFVLSWGQAQARVCKLSLNPDLQVLGASVCQVGDVVGNEYSSSRILQTHLDFGLTTMLRCPTTASILQLIDPLIHPKSSQFFVFEQRLSGYKEYVEISGHQRVDICENDD